MKEGPGKSLGLLSFCQERTQFDSFFGLSSDFGLFVGLSSAFGITTGGVTGVAAGIVITAPTVGQALQSGVTTTVGPLP